MFENTISELTGSPLLIREPAIAGLQLLCYKLIKGEQIDLQQDPEPSYAGIAVPDLENPGNPFENAPECSVAFISIVGHMLKYGMYNSWTESYTPGMDDKANLIRWIEDSPNIIGSVLYFNTPGGTTQSVIQLEDAMRNRTKPCVAFIDGMCCSAGMYTASFCDSIIASNRMCEAGSIGTQLSMLDLSGMYENFGIRQVTVRPPESKFKNTEYEAALNGDDKRLIEEQLTPYAKHFQELIKTNRPKLDLSVEGIIEGKVFYAYDCINNGLIDSIQNFSGAIAMVNSLHNDKQQFYSQLNSK